MKSLKVTFSNVKGDRLSASLELPVDGKPSAYALFAHCFTCSKDYKAVYNISRTLTLSGIAVLRFDFTGLGESEGEFAKTSFSSNVEDLVSASQFLGAEYRAPEILIGHSLGGAAALVAGSKIDSVKAVITIAAPSSPDHLLSHLGRSVQEVMERGQAPVSIAGREFVLSRDFLEDFNMLNSQEAVRKLAKPLLVLHSPQDKTVSFDNALGIFNAAQQPKSLVSLDGADHLLSGPDDSIYAGNLIGSWARRYIDTKEREELVSDAKVVARTGLEGYTTDIRAGNHGLTADEPESVGGNDLGPCPYSLLMSSLGACTSMTLRMYADRKGWPLKSIKVHLKHGKIHAKDCENCETAMGKIDRIERVIELDGDLDDAQRQRLLEIADRCPVHRTLHSEILEVTSLLDNSKPAASD